jgi:hypothetical protein
MALAQLGVTAIIPGEGTTGTIARRTAAVLATSPARAALGIVDGNAATALRDAPACGGTEVGTVARQSERCGCHHDRERGGDGGHDKTKTRQGAAPCDHDSMGCLYGELVGVEQRGAGRFGVARAQPRFEVTQLPPQSAWQPPAGIPTERSSPGKQRLDPRDVWSPIRVRAHGACTDIASRRRFRDAVARVAQGVAANVNDGDQADGR